MNVSSTGQAAQVVAQAQKAETRTMADYQVGLLKGLLDQQKKQAEELMRQATGKGQIIDIRV